MSGLQAVSAHGVGAGERPGNTRRLIAWPEPLPEPPFLLQLLPQFTILCPEEEAQQMTGMGPAHTRVPQRRGEGGQREGVIKAVVMGARGWRGGRRSPDAGLCGTVPQTHPRPASSGHGDMWYVAPRMCS